ncbi:MAG: APC family permease [Anaerolineae bacterium]|nr:APC family permease [Anaerolineae bacterium]
MLTRLKTFLIGSPLPTQELGEAKLNKLHALAAFSPDALSSIAYANQEIFLGLVVAGSAGLALTKPIGIAITTLLVVVALSYYQTIHAYPSGGGSYVVARRNLGRIPGLTAAAALMIGYLLTAAVSLTASVEAIASAFPVLWPYRIPVALAFLVLITLANLRGQRETGALMSIPVYLFLGTYLSMLLYGGIKLLVTGPVPTDAIAVPAVLPAAQPLTLAIVLRAFASGCTALTGIEAISNGVPAFKSPESKNAGKTLLAMAVLMAVLFVGSVWLTQSFAVVAGPDETILSALAHRLLGRGLLYGVIQVATMLILAVAANTSFAGFPRLAQILAHEGYLPRQLMALGDRLVYANGIGALAIATAVLIILFGGDTHALVPLFAVGVFLAFTLSQSGMVVHWLRERGRGWGLKAILNGLGALATGVTVLIVGVSKFVEGAWITIILIPLLVLLFGEIHKYYRQLSEALSSEPATPGPIPTARPRIVIPISGINRATGGALSFAQAITHDVTALYIEIEPGTGAPLRKQWEEQWPGIPLVVRPSPYRTILRPLLEFLDEIDAERNDGQLAAVILAEFVPGKWWQNLLHNHTAGLIRSALLYRRRYMGYQRAIIDIPIHLN